MSGSEVGAADADSVRSAPPLGRVGRWGTVALTTLVAGGAAVIVHAIGRAFGARYEFTAVTGAAVVDTATVFGFAVLPVAVGMIVAALLSRWWRWMFPVALIVAIVLALGTIPIMVVPTDFDTVSATALALCHVAVLLPVLWGLVALRRLDAERH
jgi:MFS family permease